MMCRSVRQTPAPPILTMTSSGPWSLGSAMSSIEGSDLYWCTRPAFTLVLLPVGGWRSADRRAEAHRLGRAGVGRRLGNAFVEGAVLGHQRLVPGRLLLGHQRVGGEDQAGDRGAVLQCGAHHAQGVDDAELDHV